MTSSVKLNPLDKKKPCLFGYTFLITRPKHQAENLCSKIAAYQGKSVLLPTLAIKVFSDQVIRQAITNLLPCDIVIFSSANAVNALMPHWSLMQTRMQLRPKVLAVGSGTADVLASFAIKTVIPTTQFNSQGLLAVEDLQQVTKKHIVIFAGLGGSTMLQEQLQQRGAKVKKIALYKRIKPAETLPLPTTIPIHCIISTSQESLKNLCAMTTIMQRTWLFDQQLLVISPDMVLLAQQLGFKKPSLLASNASDLAILARLVDTIGSN